MALVEPRSVDRAEPVVSRTESAVVSRRVHGSMPDIARITFSVVLSDEPTVRRIASMLTIGVLLTGCGSSHETSSPSDASSVRSVALSFIKASARGAGGMACGLMTSAAQRKTAGDARRLQLGNTCQAAIAEVGRRLRIAGAVSEVDDSKITALSITGDRATVTIETGGRSGPGYLRKIDGRWLIDNGPPS
jgi:hypothetical protein